MVRLERQHGLLEFRTPRSEGRYIAQHARQRRVVDWRQFEDLRRHGADAVRGNHVVRENIPDPCVAYLTRRCRIVNGAEANRTALSVRSGGCARGSVARKSGIEQAAEIASLKGGNRQGRKTGLAIVLEFRALEVMEEEGSVPAVIDLRQIYRAANRIPEVMLFERLAGHTRGIAVEGVGAQRIILTVVIRRPVKVVRTRLGREIGYRRLAAGILC